MRWLAILGILIYRALLRPFVRRRCLYEESCSAFGIRALRQHGVRGAYPFIRGRIRSCRLPAAACFVLDEQGQARLISAEGFGGQRVPPSALAFFASRAEQLSRSHRGDGLP